jgi:hypothetical protein
VVNVRDAFVPNVGGISNNRVFHASTPPALPGVKVQCSYESTTANERLHTQPNFLQCIFIDAEERQDNVNNVTSAWSVPHHALEHFGQTAKKDSGVIFDTI